MFSIIYYHINSNQKLETGGRVSRQISSPIASLPEEMVTKIFTFLSLTDLKGGSRTCRLWNTLSKDKDLLHEIRVNENSISLKHLPTSLVFLQLDNSFIRDLSILRLPTRLQVLTIE